MLAGTDKEAQATLSKTQLRESLSMCPWGSLRRLRRTYAGTDIEHKNSGSLLINFSCLLSFWYSLYFHNELFLRRRNCCEGGSPQLKSFGDFGRQISSYPMFQVPSELFEGNIRRKGCLALAKVKTWGDAGKLKFESCPHSQSENWEVTLFHCVYNLQDDF